MADAHKPPSVPPRTPTANPNLSLVLHWLTEVVILGALWWAVLQRQIPTWMALVASAVIGGWVPASMVLQVLGVMGRAQLGQPPAPGALPAPETPQPAPTPSPVVPPPVTAFLAALAWSAMHRGHVVVVVTLASGAAGYALERALG